MRNRPSFLQGVLVAVLLALAASALHAGLGWLMTPVGAARLIVALLAGAYVLFLLSRSEERTGRVATSIIWLAGAIGVGLVAKSWAPYLLAHVAMVWLVRSLYYHASTLSALADLGLSLLALCAAAWAAAHTGSLLLTIWCFFLVQALFVAIPQRLAHSAARPAHAGDEKFRHARRSADAALRRLCIPVDPVQ